MAQLEKDVQKLAKAFQRDWLDRAITRMNNMTPYPNKEQRIKILTEEKERNENL